MKSMIGCRAAVLIVAVLACAGTVRALEPPTPEQLARYRQDGSLASRAEAARDLGNHRMAPHLAARLSSTKTAAAGWGLPAEGTPRVLALLIAFSDYPGSTDSTTVNAKLFGDGDPMAYPYESLRNFYRRASYNLLDIGGNTLGWYTAPYPRSAVAQTTEGREGLIREAITSFDAAGHDFSQYDNNGDGTIDYFIVVWTGPHQDWAEFWWGYQTSFQDGSFRVDNTRLGVYSWQWENYNWPGPFTSDVVIHETGHALGLPDYYDYDDSIGPRGGVGGLDQMDSNWGDHNCFSKYVLGWLTPETANHGTVQLLLSPTGEAPEAALLMNGNPRTDPYGEHFMVQFRRRQANDSGYPADGLLVWHVDARTGPGGGFLYDNSYTEHKLLRLMEADGLEEIEQNGSADAGDYFMPGGVFGTDTHPSSHRYDGAATNLLVDEIAAAGDEMALRASLGSGCALSCEAAVARTAWPRSAIAFAGSVATENCAGSPSSGWTVGGSVLPGGASVEWALPAGDYDWSFDGQLGDASCSRQGELLVCADQRCWQWHEAPADGCPASAARGASGSTTAGCWWRAAGSPSSTTRPPAAGTRPAPSPAPSRWRGASSWTTAGCCSPAARRPTRSTPPSMTRRATAGGRPRRCTPIAPTTRRRSSATAGCWSPAASSTTTGARRCPCSRPRSSTRPPRPGARSATFRRRWTCPG